MRKKNISYFCLFKPITAVKKLFLLLLILSSPLLSDSLAWGQASGVNATAHLDKPYVILISLDGYRWDYTQRFQPPNLLRLIEEGVQAEGLIPCFPSKTFPNHYSIATGLTPEHHGLVDNAFFDPARNATYQIRDRKVVEDGTWYGGTPLWVNAEQAGMVAASFFFVGSEADVQGIWPSYWQKYDGSVPNAQRVAQVLDWLRLPEAQRPHLITLYFSDMDDTGHAFGPNRDDKLQESLLALDEILGGLFRGIQDLGLPVNTFIVSDHGMAEVPVDHFFPIDPLLDEERYQVVNNGPLAHVYLRDSTDIGLVLAQLEAQEGLFQAYRRSDFPYYEGNRDDPRLGDLILLTDFPYYFSDARRLGMMRRSDNPVRGEHGFDPAHLDMHGIFYAQGPNIQAGLTIPRFSNVHIYPLICHILDLPLPEAGIDGDFSVLAPILKKP